MEFEVWKRGLWVEEMRVVNFDGIRGFGCFRNEGKKVKRGVLWEGKSVVLVVVGDEINEEQYIVGLGFIK